MRCKKNINNKRLKYSLIAIILVSISIILGNFISKYFNKKEEIIDTLVVEEIPLKNDDSGYLRLEEDIYADSAIEVQNMLNTYDYYRNDNRKIAYLTFDDGPSQFVTEKILDILKDNNIKATFFVTGSSLEKNSKAPEIMKRMVKDGHAIGNHTYSHDYNILYPQGVGNIDAFVQDINKNEEILKKILGKDFKCRVVRMPGGSMSWDVSELINKLNSTGYGSIDWNSLNGDAQGRKKNPEALLETLKNTVGDKENVVVLMHDTDAKEDTYNFLQSAINYLIEEGFEFRTIK